MRFLEPGNIGSVVGHCARTTGICLLSKQRQLSEVLCAVPIGLGTRVIQDVVQ